MGQIIYQVDAFTDKPFSGDPAAVCIMAESGDEVWMQNIAKEMNLSETAFLYRQDDGFNLRWFTPAIEVDLCGHATLASTHILSRSANATYLPIFLTTSVSSGKYELSAGELVTV